MTWGQASTPLASYLKAGVAHRKGAHEISRNHIRAALDEVRWDKRTSVMTWNGYEFYTDEVLPYGGVYVNGKDKVIVTSPDTWKTLSFDGPALKQFMSDMVMGSSGMKFLTMDAGPYARAARAEAEKSGGDVPDKGDTLTWLHREADAILTQAAGLQDATPMQRQIFFVRYAELQEKMASFAAEVEKVQAQVDLAGAAVTDL